jgi:hypothetical protein
MIPPSRRQPKQPSKRAFTALAGSPWQQLDQAEPTPAAPETPTPAAPVKRGRPAKNGVAMSPAQRKAQSRAAHAAKLADGKRRGIVAQLMKIYRRRQAVVVEQNGDWRKAERQRSEDRQRLRDYHQSLLALPIGQLELTLEGHSTPDTRGRLPKERSGEQGRKHGMSEPERIIGAIEHQNGRVTPDGQGLKSYDQDTSEGTPEEDSGRPHYERMSPEYLKKLAERDKMFTELAEQYCEVFPKQLHVGCRLCHTILQLSDAVEHYWQEYERGWKLYDHYLKLEASGVCPEDILGAARYAYVNHKHLQRTWVKIREDRRARRKRRIS